MQRNSDFWLGLLIFMAAVPAMWAANRLRALDSADPLGPAFLPLVMTGTIAALGLTLVVRNIRSVTAAETDADERNEARNSRRRVTGVAAVYTLYVFGARYVDFYIATFVATFVLLFLGGMRSYVGNALIAVAATAFCFLVFARLLGLPLGDI